jgi:hypothetical protein
MGSRMAVARHRELAVIEADGSARSLILASPVRSLLRASGEFLAAFLEDGSLSSVDCLNLSLRASTQAVNGPCFAAVSGRSVIVADGSGRLERYSLPELAPLGFVDIGQRIGGLAANGEGCLLLDGEGRLLATIRLGAFSAKGDETSSPALSSGASSQAQEQQRGSVARLYGSESAFLAVYSDGRGVFMGRGGTLITLPVGFDPELEGYASGDSFALVSSSGKAVRVDQSEEGEPIVKSFDFEADMALPLGAELLWHRAGILGVSDKEGKTLATIPYGLSPLWPPDCWNGRLVVADGEGLRLFSAHDASAADGYLEKLFLSAEAEQNIGRSLDAMRARSASGDAVSAFIDMEAWVPGVRRPFPDLWRVSLYKAESGGVMTVSVSGGKAYCIAAYDENGAKLLSNVDYEVGRPLELTVAEGRKYAIAFAPWNREEASIPAQLAITVR